MELVTITNVQILKPYARNILVDGGECPTSRFRRFYSQEKSSDTYSIQNHMWVFQKHCNEQNDGDVKNRFDLETIFFAV